MGKTPKLKASKVRTIAMRATERCVHLAKTTRGRKTGNILDINTVKAKKEKNAWNLHCKKKTEKNTLNRQINTTQFEKK